MFPGYTASWHFSPIENIMDVSESDMIVSETPQAQGNDMPTEQCSQNKDATMSTTEHLTSKEAEITDNLTDDDHNAASPSVPQGEDGRAEAEANQQQDDDAHSELFCDQDAPTPSPEPEADVAQCASTPPAEVEPSLQQDPPTPPADQDARSSTGDAGPDLYDEIFPGMDIDASPSIEDYIERDFMELGYHDKDESTSPSGKRPALGNGNPQVLDTVEADQSCRDAPIKKEPHIKIELDAPLEWMQMDVDTISISSGEEERFIDLTSEEDQYHGTGQPSTTPNEPTTILTKEQASKKLPNLKVHGQDESKMRERQQQLLRQFYKGKGNETDLLTPSDLPRPENEMDDEDEDQSWMYSKADSDANAGQAYQEAKCAYEKKKDLGENTPKDDLEFMRIESREDSRRQRLKRRFQEELGYDLEVSSPTQSSRRGTKRSSAAVTEGDDQAKASRKRGPKKKQDTSGFDFQREEENNMGAGLEATMKKQLKKFMKNAASAEAQQDSSKGGKKGKKTKKLASGSYRNIGRDQGKKSRKKAGYITDIESLFTSNVFVDAANNRLEGPQKQVKETDKLKFLAGLVADLPMHDARRQEKNHIKACTIKLGKGKVKPAADGSMRWAVEGLKATLTHHQIQGVAWMIEREMSSLGPPGGIVADAMGLGKTIEAITLIARNPPDQDEEECRATLIVVPPGLLSQWYEELEKHANDNTFKKITVLTPVNRLLGKGMEATIAQADIVLTTYQEVVASYPKVEIPDNFPSIDALKDWWKHEWESSRDVLHRVKFHRVILDESQAIKNHKSQTSIACRAIMAKHHWALSGTPVMNRLEEFYPYFRFIRVSGVGTIEDFRDTYCLDEEESKKRMKVMLNNIMIRRTMATKVLGDPILVLPRFTVGVQRLNFSTVERLVYEVVSRRFARAINMAAKNGKLAKTPIFGVVMFLRLRQLSAHLFLIQEVLKDLFEPEHVDRLENHANQNSSGIDREKGQKIIAALRRMIGTKGDDVEGDEEEANKNTTSEKGTPESDQAPKEKPKQLANKLAKKIRGLYRNGQVEKVKDLIVCQRCHEVAIDPWVTDCLHVYCAECLNSIAVEAAVNDCDSARCINCNKVYTKSEACSGLKELEADDLKDLTPNLSGRQKQKKVDMRWVEYDDTLLLSAKTAAVEDQLTKWIEEAQERKIVVFSQFLMIMRIMECVCARRGWNFCSYNGTMSRKARDQAIKNFGDPDSKIKVMIASLKCGGVGLNLTMASRITCIDLWYNSAVEEQAFCRIFRFGQEHETECQRFLVKNCVDDRLEDMQIRKKEKIGFALDDKSLLNKMDAEEVMSLFGNVKFDTKAKRNLIALEENAALDDILPAVPEGEDDPVVNNIVNGKY